MNSFNITSHVHDEIKKHLLFFISDEKIYSSTLYELIRMSPGNWFDIEELANRASVKKLCTDINVIRNIIKTLDKFEHNDLSICLKSLSI